jgi:3'-5' exoribonuclease
MGVAPLRCCEWEIHAEVEGHARVSSAKAAIAKNGNPYLVFGLHDGDGVAFDAKQFSSVEEPPTAGTVLFIRATVDNYDGPLSLKIATWQIAPSIPAHHFLPWMPAERRASRAELDALITGIGDEPLRALVEAVFDDDARARFAVHPAARRNHGAVVAGLLTHTVRVTQMALALATFVPVIDNDLLLAAALLHDIGKLDELSEQPGVEYTEPGKLLGHVTLGMLRVNEIATTIPDLAPDRKQLLLHVIQAAHGKKEYGAPVVPATFEALLLSLSDDAESKIEARLEAVERMPPGAPWTPYVKNFQTPFRVPDALIPEEPQTTGDQDWPDPDDVPF